MDKLHWLGDGLQATEGDFPPGTMESEGSSFNNTNLVLDDDDADHFVGEEEAMHEEDQVNFVLGVKLFKLNISVADVRNPLWLREIKTKKINNRGMLYFFIRISVKFVLKL